jgi:serine/threonine-protein kinase
MGSSDAEVDYALQLCNEYYGGCEWERFRDEQPQHTVYLDAFWIDKYEVTNAQYRRCVKAGVCQAPMTCDRGEPTYEDTSKAEHPVVCVSWYRAKAYCEWTGARLPTEAEWEKAARGADGWIYPWGNTPDGSKLNSCDVNCPEHEWKDALANDGYAYTAPVGSYPAGASPYGAVDMAGNVWEWTQSLWGENRERPDFKYPYNPEDGRENTEASKDVLRVLRGGSWYIAGVRIADRHGCRPRDRNPDVGFRCARGSE